VKVTAGGRRGEWTAVCIPKEGHRASGALCLICRGGQNEAAGADPTVRSLAAGPAVIDASKFFTSFHTEARNANIWVVSIRVADLSLCICRIADKRQF
jgi:hypothetical protein